MAAGGAREKRTQSPRKWMIETPPWGQHHDLNQALPGLASDSLIHSQIIWRRETVVWKMAIGDNGYWSRYWLSPLWALVPSHLVSVWLFVHLSICPFLLRSINLTNSVWEPLSLQETLWLLRMVISREDVYARTYGWELKNGLDSGGHLWPPAPRLWHVQRVIRCEDQRGAGCCWLRMDDREVEKDVLWGWIGNRTQVRVWWSLGKEFGCRLGKALYLCAQVSFCLLAHTSWGSAVSSDRCESCVMLKEQQGFEHWKAGDEVILGKGLCLPGS